MINFNMGPINDLKYTDAVVEQKIGKRQYPITHILYITDLKKEMKFYNLSHFKGIKEYTFPPKNFAFRVTTNAPAKIKANTIPNTSIASFLAAKLRTLLLL